MVPRWFKMAPKLSQDTSSTAPRKRPDGQIAPGRGGVPLSYACYIGRTPAPTTYQQKQVQNQPPETPLIPNDFSQLKKTINKNAEARDCDFDHLAKSSRAAQDGAQCCLFESSWNHLGLFVVSTSSKMSQDSPKDDPRRPQDGPKMSQDRPRTTQERSRTAPR